MDMNFPHKDIGVQTLNKVEADFADEAESLLPIVDHEALVDAIKTRQQSGHSAKLFSALKTGDAKNLQSRWPVTGEHVLEERIQYFANRKTNDNHGCFRPDVAGIFAHINSIERTKRNYDRPVNLDD